MTITVMSYNTQHCLNFVTRQIDFDLIAETIRHCNADIIGLQEMRDMGDDAEYQAQTKILAEKLGYYHYFAEAFQVNGHNPYGNALLSRFPIREAETVAIPNPETPQYDGYYEPRCLLKATVEVGDGLTVLVSHFGLNLDEQESAVKTVASHLPQKRAVLMGDFNVTPDNAVLAPLRACLFDAADKFDAPKLSYPSDVPTMKIDYVFVSRDVTVQTADIPAVVSSDHRPHVATIEVDATQTKQLSANMRRSQFYVCPVCGNVLHAVGEAEIRCCGNLLLPQKAVEVDDAHAVKVERVEDEHFVTVDHPMTKEHFISFVAYVTCDRVQFVKFYPEGNAETRLNFRGSGDLYICCNRHGLMKMKV